MKKILSLILVLCLAISIFPIAVFADYTPKYTVYADGLYELGLFRGTGTDKNGKPVYELGRTPTRAEALTLLIRLLGEEEDALECTGGHPFTDVPAGNWAEPYVSYAYAKGYTNGMSATTFAPGETANANMYLTFLLRALGYDDSRGDFSYFTAYKKAAETGICRSGEYVSGSFYRDDCVYTSWRALLAGCSDESGSLASRLSASGAIDGEKARELGLLYNSGVYGITVSGTAASVEVCAPEGMQVSVTVLRENGNYAASGSAKTTEGHTAVSVPLSGLPSSYVISAQIVNGLGIPLCDEYTSREYTKDFQTFMAKTPEDFAGQTIITFDDEADNFAVIGNSVRQSEETQHNTLISADEKNGVYVLGNIDSTVSSLREGDLFYDVYGSGPSDYIILKVGSITLENSTATITAAQAEVSEFFDFARIDMQFDPEDGGFDASDADEGVTYLGVSRTASLQDLDVSINPTMSLEFALKLSYGKFQGAGKYELGVKLHIRLFVDNKLFGKDNYDITVQLTTTNKMSLDFTTTLAEVAPLGDLKLGTYSVPTPIPGITVDFDAYFIFKLAAEASFTYSRTTTNISGFRYSTDLGYTTLDGDTASDENLDLSQGVKLTIGPRLDIGISAIWILHIKMRADSVLEVKVEQAVPVDDSRKHLCAACFQGSVKTIKSLSFVISVGIGEKLVKDLINVQLAKIPKKHFDFHVSTNSLSSPYKFALGGCDNYSYRVTFVVVDPNGDAVSGAALSLPGYPDMTTDADGKAVAYLKAGQTLTVTAKETDSYAAVSAAFTTVSRTMTVKLTVNVASAGENSPYHVSVMRNSLTTTIKYTYDSHGNLLSETTSNENQAKYYPDYIPDREFHEYTYSGDRIKKEKVTKYDVNSTSPDSEEIFTYTYDEKGRVISMTNEEYAFAGETTYTYDANGRLVLEYWQNKNNASNYHSYAYTYDKYGNTLTIVYHQDNGMEDRVEYKYVYDAKGRVISRTLGDETTTYKYDSAGRVIEESGEAWSGEPLVIKYFYDKNGCMTREERYLDGTLDYWADYEYVYIPV